VVIYFRTKKLRDLCSKEKEGVKALGANCAKRLRQRLMELSAAESLADIPHAPPPRLHALTGDRDGQFSVDLAHPYRLLFILADDPLPLNENNEIDRARVREIEIIDITDTH